MTSSSSCNGGCLWSALRTRRKAEEEAGGMDYKSWSFESQISQTLITDFSSALRLHCLDVSLGKQIQFQAG